MQPDRLQRRLGPPLGVVGPDPAGQQRQGDVLLRGEQDGERAALRDHLDAEPGRLRAVADLVVAEASPCPRWPTAPPMAHSSDDFPAPLWPVTAMNSPA